MLTYTYIREGKFGLVEKSKLRIQHERAKFKSTEAENQPSIQEIISRMTRMRHSQKCARWTKPKINIQKADPCVGFLHSKTLYVFQKEKQLTCRIIRTVSV